MDIVLRPIGVIHTPFREPADMPIQPRFGAGVAGHVEVFEEFAAGLADLGGFSHLHLIYFMHRATGYSLEVVPYLDDEPRGLFATRAPRRPNPIGLSVVRLVRVDGRLLDVEDLDIVDGTPLLDIKPFVPAVDNRGHCRVGWLEEVDFETRDGRSDERFVEDEP